MAPPSAADLATRWKNADWHASQNASHPFNNLNLRLRRALSWLERAEKAHHDGDHDTAFILYWIAFNAAYGQTGSAADGEQREHVIQQAYFGKIAGLDPSLRETLASQEMWDAICALLNSKYVYEPFWRHHNGMPGNRDWEARFRQRTYTSWSAMRRLRATTIAADENVVSVLREVFERLYTLRNQLLHGGATWNSSVNRHQVETGTVIMTALMPRFIEAMIENPDTDWGTPRYPVVKD